MLDLKLNNINQEQVDPYDIMCISAEIDQQSYILNEYATALENLISVQEVLYTQGPTQALEALVGDQFRNAGIELSLEGIGTTIVNAFNSIWNGIKKFFNWLLNLIGLGTKDAGSKVSNIKNNSTESESLARKVDELNKKVNTERTQPQDQLKNNTGDQPKKLTTKVDEVLSRPVPEDTPVQVVPKPTEPFKPSENQSSTISQNNNTDQPSSTTDQNKIKVNGQRVPLVNIMLPAIIEGEKWFIITCHPGLTGVIQQLNIGSDWLADAIVLCQQISKHPEKDHTSKINELKALQGVEKVLKQYRCIMKPNDRVVYSSLPKLADTYKTWLDILAPVGKQYDNLLKKADSCITKIMTPEFSKQPKVQEMVKSTISLFRNAGSVIAVYEKHIQLGLTNIDAYTKRMTHDLKKATAEINKNTKGGLDPKLKEAAEKGEVATVKAILIGYLDVASKVDLCISHAHSARSILGSQSKQLFDDDDGRDIDTNKSPKDQLLAIKAKLRTNFSEKKLKLGYNLAKELIKE